MMYPKIYGPFRRDNDNKVNREKWFNIEFEVLRNATWVFSEKVDGTNIRIEYDGHTVQYAGRTDRAVLHPDLLKSLESSFPVELMEQQFHDTPVTLFGEGYGAGIQHGGDYRTDKGFILFDVFINNYWLSSFDVEGVAKGFAVPTVPLTHGRTLNQVIDIVSDGHLSELKDGFAEGFVGVPAGGLLNRHGGRIQVKVKHVDLYRE